ncbi:MAG TPA: fructosamine kinase family protein [Chthonomonadaceae bacterium]|nr:fructosamine kinase family protein [Chthonomonadaceae bacterium]
MTGLPSGLAMALTEVLGAAPVRAMPLGGGMINRAARVDLPDGVVFVKWKDDAPPGFFAAEADGLFRLRASQTLRVPRVLAFHDRDATTIAPPLRTFGQRGRGSPRSGGWVRSLPLFPVPFLALEYIAEHRPADESRFARRFGERLAALHQQTVSPFGAFGLEKSNFLGVMVQLNTPHDCWPAFYRDCRLLPQIAIARQNGLLPPEREQRLMEVVAQIDRLMDGLDARPTLLHGDLWSGNFLAASEEPVVIDPAVYYGEREVEIAYMELFGGFPPGLLPAYRAAFPLPDGYARRRPMHQLYPLLIHVNHFGETYGPRLDSTLARIA